MKTTPWAMLLLVFLASIRVIANLCGWTMIGAAASVTSAAPAMKVFTAHNGYETFSSQFYLQVVYEDGSAQRVLMTPERYRGLLGPYNRRNVYGAAIAYGPVLVKGEATRPMWQAVARYAFCMPGQVSVELGLGKSSPVHEVTINYFTAHATTAVSPSNTIDEQLRYPNTLSISCESH